MVFAKFWKFHAMTQKSQVIFNYLFNLLIFYSLWPSRFGGINYSGFFRLWRTQPGEMFQVTNQNVKYYLRLLGDIRLLQSFCFKFLETIFLRQNWEIDIIETFKSRRMVKWCDCFSPILMNCKVRILNQVATCFGKNQLAHIYQNKILKSFGGIRLLHVLCSEP